MVKNRCIQCDAQIEKGMYCSNCEQAVRLWLDEHLPKLPPPAIVASEREGFDSVVWSSFRVKSLSKPTPPLI